ncbi:MAG: uracil-DNA glycosylase [Firmicutes bacterium]|nr:uracil-DNA glycosylase [Bacillota bacterium]
MVQIGNDWDFWLQPEFAKPYFASLWQKVQNDYASGVVYPSKENIFRAFASTPYKDTKVVILGQDPYHDGSAEGLCFSCTQKIPPSLKNIFWEISKTVGKQSSPRQQGDLRGWADQGILLLNSTLTVRAHDPNSHKDYGWQSFCDRVITLLSQKDTPIVFLLWGNFAKTKQKLITNPKHLVLTAVHPSPLSAHNGFFGCNHFVLANQFLQQNGCEPIDWLA